MEPLANVASASLQEGRPEGEQVLASPSLGHQVISATDQNLTSLGDVVARDAGTLVSIRGTTTQAALSTSAAVSGDGPRKQKRTAEKKRAGGWQPSPRLSWQQVKEIDEAVHRLAGLGVAPTHCITIMPPAPIAADNKRKRFCVGKIAHIGEALKRHDQPHIGLTTVENPFDADLHVNHLVFVPRGERKTIARFHNPPCTHVEAIYDLPGVVAYVTKERRRMSPGFERAINRPWQRCRPVPGKRWTLTADARAALARYASAASVTDHADASPKPEPPSTNDNMVQLAEPVQLDLTLVAPVIDLCVLAEEKRKAMGMPQHALARHLGIRQPQYSNAVVRRHDTLSPWARNRLREFVADKLGGMTMTKTAKKPAKPESEVHHDASKLKGALKAIGGSMSDDWNNLIANQTVQALWLKHSDPETKATQYSATVAALVGIDPKDELEGMMAAQLIAAHNAAMEWHRRAMIGEQTFEGRRENLSQANKPSRTYATLLEALNRHRGKGQQKVTVEHVTVHQGGQAVVGNVSHRGGGTPKSEDQPHALGHATGAAMPSQIEAERETVPVAGSAG